MEDTPLRVMLEEYKKCDYHLAMAQRIVSAENSDPTYELVGVVTLEDIVEEIFHESLGTLREPSQVTCEVNPMGTKRTRR
ncbi:hypothetical protein KIN20_015693 [Parelaphostrongylus tenuis]|uniref:CBS domain-containing protein n=1 Tax=Parelaphostrongylus tenuis TaxID=148309 RepID=A0AAD5QMF1_PARTN|nr:hypothetical protein KIN20_015693 [Parelaphostrongylus tenuis]